MTINSVLAAFRDVVIIIVGFMLIFGALGNL